MLWCFSPWTDHSVPLFLIAGVKNCHGIQSVGLEGKANNLSPQRGQFPLHHFAFIGGIFAHPPILLLLCFLSKIRQ